jgi:hypothetical protein
MAPSTAHSTGLLLGHTRVHVQMLLNTYVVSSRMRRGQTIVERRAVEAVRFRSTAGRSLWWELTF